jgi:hypothetical protein
MSAHATIELSAATRLTYRTAPWDARVLGGPVLDITTFEGSAPDELRALLVRFDAVAAATGAGLAYVRVDGEARAQKRALLEDGFAHVETSYRVAHTRVQQAAEHDRFVRRGAELVPADGAALDVIRRILAEDFEHGRLHEDPWVPREAAAARYRNWLDDLVAQEHEIYAYVAQGRVVGLHVQKRRGDVADLVLTGVTRSHALLGVPLWATALRLVREQGVREARTLISAANVPIVNLYARLGFTFTTCLLGFHKRYPA